MDTEAMELFTSMLALATGAGALVILVAAVLARSVPAARTLIDAVRELGPWLIFAVSGGAMAGSLWFSEVADFAPCKLCWYQRIALFSIAIISLVAAIRRDRRIAPYTLALAAVGVLVSTYHYLLEWFPQLETNVCSVDVPCTSVWFRGFGFVSLALMAGLAGLFVIVVSSVLVAGEKSSPR
jgi:disulfide bond formation protein DsbB